MALGEIPPSPSKKGSPLGRACLVFIFPDVTRFTPLLARLVQ